MSDPLPDPGLAGLVLAGGRSRRLGRDKALLPVDGMSLLARTLLLARLFCDDVYVSGRDPNRGPGRIDLPGEAPAPLSSSIPWLPDDAPGLGPIGGILTGLQRLGRPLLVLACDLPRLNAATLARLVAARAHEPRETVVTLFRHEDTGYLEPLAAIYELEAAALLKASIQAGVFQLTRALPDLVRRHILTDRESDWALCNVNTPDELHALRQEAPSGAEPRGDAPSCPKKAQA